MTILPYSYDTTMSNLSYLYDNIVIFICQLHLVWHRVHYYSYDHVTISKGQTTTTDTPWNGAVMNAALRCGKCIWWSLRLLELYTKSSSNSLHHGTLSSVHIICTYRVLCGQKMYKVTAVTKSTIYTPPSQYKAAVITSPPKKFW